jgi:hypothetical protein
MIRPAPAHGSREPSDPSASGGTSTGFPPEDGAEPGSEHLVDAMVAWGSIEAIRRRITRLHDAGADHVALIPLGAGGTSERLATLEALAPGT